MKKQKLLLVVMLVVLIVGCIGFASCSLISTTINFDPNYEGATVIQKQYFMFSSRTIPEGPQREGYTFDGWYVDKECTNPLNQEKLDNAEDGTTFYAKWLEGEQQNSFERLMIELSPFRDVCVGESFDPSMFREVVAIYNGGAMLPLTYNTGNKSTDYTVTNFNTSSAGEMTFQVCFAGLTENVTVEVVEVKLISIEAEYVGDVVPFGRTFDETAFVVTAYYNNGTSHVVKYPDYVVDVDSFKPQGIGGAFVFISYTNDLGETQKTSAYIVIGRAVVEKLEVGLTSRHIATDDPGPHDNTGIYQYDELSDELFVVTATYSDGETRIIHYPDYDVTGFDTSTVGEVFVVFSCDGATLDYAMNVKEVVFEGISVIYSGPEFYPKGGSFSAESITVYGYYSNGNKEVIKHSNGSNGGYTYKGFSSQYAGEVTVTVTYSKDGHDYKKEISLVIRSDEVLGITAEYVGGTFYDGDELLRDNIKVWLLYNNNIKIVTTDYSISDNFDNTQDGEQIITITYNVDTSITTTLPIPVVRRTVVDITATYDGTILVGEPLDTSKLTVTLYFNNNTSMVMTALLLGEIDTSTPGMKSLDVSCDWHGQTPTTTVKIKVVDPNASVSNDLSIHFLELGNKFTGDAVYIKAGETDILIDAGSRYESATTITNYIDQYCEDRVLEYVIATHAHQDHIAGFYGDGNSTGIFDYYECKTIIDFARTGATSQVYQRYVQKRNAEVAQGAKHYTALDCVKEQNGAKKVYNLTEDGSIKMEILYQEYYEKNTSNENNYSVCVMITQGDNHYLFTGDLEGEGEASLVNNNPNLPHMQLWKGGHHGSYTAASTELMAKIQPECVCICTCMGTTEYTTGSHVFPAQEFCDRVAPYTDAVYVTTYAKNYSSGIYESANGNIVYKCIDGQVILEFSGNNLKLKDTDWFKANRTMPAAWKNGTSMYH